MTTEPTTVTDEIAAMRRIVAAMDRLDPKAQDRVVTWLWDRYHITAEDELSRIEVPYERIPKDPK